MTDERSDIRPGLRRRRAPCTGRCSPTTVDLNGIDFVEVDAADHTILRVTFLKPIPVGAYGLARRPDAGISIAGGTRIVGITRDRPRRRVDFRPADRRRPGAATSRPTSSHSDAPDLDPVKRGTVFCVHGELPDRRRLPAGAVPAARGSSSRCSTTSPRTTRASASCSLDLLPTLNPDWIERNPSDLGIALVELLAYTGDHLSYYQDAVANEAYLDTRAHTASRRAATRA